MLGIVAIVFVIVLWVRTKTSNTPSEGYVDSLAQGINDRGNPLAVTTNPLENPAAPLGISQKDAQNLRDITQTALNIPTQIPLAQGGFKEQAPENPNQPRIDDENSLLGLVSFCKTEGAKGGDAFNNPKFAANCGMCLTSGTLITGEAFNTPTGVVVYPKDKETSIKDARMNSYPFPRTIPSLRAATCVGASLGPDAKPSLAISREQYDDFAGIVKCKGAQQVGNGCAVCVADSSFTYFKPGSTVNPSYLFLVGEGSVDVSVSGNSVGGLMPLNASQITKIPLGRVQEGSLIQIKVVKGDSVEGPTVAGVLKSVTPQEKPFVLPLDRFIQKDAATGSFPRRGQPRFVEALSAALATFKPGGAGTEIVLEGPMPLTFLESDNIAAYSCNLSPIATTAESAALLVDDPCLNPLGQGPGNYSSECLQKKVLEAGCSSDGSWFKNPQDAYKESGGQGTVGTFVSWILGLAPQSKSNPDIAMKCLGNDIRTPCDAYSGAMVPDRACMKYLFDNQGERSNVGRTYIDSLLDFTGLRGRSTPSFCTDAGTLNPDTDAGYAELSQIASSGYKGVQGIEAVRKYLSDIFNRATGDLDANVDDSAGGRKTSIQKCFGLSIVEPPVTQVKSNSKGTIGDGTCQTFLPSSFTPEGGKSYGQVELGQDYEISFTIVITGREANWGSILHFSKGGDCCGFGDRLPAIWLFPAGTKLHVRLGDSTEGNWGLDSDDLPMNTPVNVRLRAVGSNVTLQVGEKTFSAQQPTYRPSGLATIWAGDPWYPPARVTITNFCYAGY